VGGWVGGEGDVLFRTAGGCTQIVNQEHFPREL
jgi:hypothetical protein